MCRSRWLTHLHNSTIQFTSQQASARCNIALKMESNTTIIGEPSTPQISPHKIGVTLIGMDLWRQFDAIGTEMVVTRSGRRLFPIPEVRLSGLNPNAQYSIVLRLQLVTPERLFFSKQNGWGQLLHPIDEQQVLLSSFPLGLISLHPMCQKSGSTWLNATVLFDKVRITNNVDKANDPYSLVVQTNHKYSLVLDVVEHLPNELTATPLSFQLPYTQFITTSSYQNPAMAHLKIYHNPCARAFREKRSDLNNKRKSVDETSSANSSEESDALSPPAAKRSSPSVLPQTVNSYQEVLSPPSVQSLGIMSPWFFESSFYWYQQACVMTGQLPYLQFMPLFPLTVPGVQFAQQISQLTSSATYSFENLPTEETEQPCDLSLPKKHT